MFNWAYMQQKANYDAAKARARGAETYSINRNPYIFEYKNDQYEISDLDGNYIIAFNTRKITVAKKWFREYLNN